jgi:hypothetical protein
MAWDAALSGWRGWNNNGMSSGHGPVSAALDALLGDALSLRSLLVDDGRDRMAIRRIVGISL